MKEKEKNNRYCEEERRSNPFFVLRDCFTRVLGIAMTKRRKKEKEKKQSSLRGGTTKQSVLCIKGLLLPSSRDRNDEKAKEGERKKTIVIARRNDEAICTS
jgi:hypothetical protein